ncbi:MAG: hypothetical protein QNJ77_06525 [Acidimicrobiia bacterium]|nr:hypothetical protein [Acidimicrobiia bacterium]
MRRLNRTVTAGWMLVAILALGACTNGTVQGTGEGEGRLAIVDDGNVVVLDADGSNRVAVTDVAPSGADRAFYFQPTWSPDGTLLAFSQISPERGIHVADPDTSGRWSLPTSSFPFYFHWSTGNELALLRNGESGLRLDTTSIADGALSELEQLDAGQPLYFSWSPSGTEMVTHIGSDRLEINIAGSAQALGPVPGQFQAPVWTDRGIIAIDHQGNDRYLALIDTTGDSSLLARVPGPTNFVATPDGSKIAAQSMRDSDALSVAYQTTPRLAAGRVVVIDVEGGDLQTVTENPAIAFFWSPDGRRLLVLDAVASGEARWSIWEDGEMSESVRFEPDPSFLRELLPFFDQYAQSVTLWSPDGSAFAFPGAIDGESGIWVKADGSAPQRVSDGTWVAWSSR